MQEQNAPGAPGVEPHWAPGGKTGVGTALSDTSNVWFSLGHGILNEVYYPRVDTPAIRDLGLLITCGNYFSEEKTDTDSVVSWLAPAVPAFELTNTAHGGRYQVIKQIVVDPGRSTVLQKIKLQPAQGKIDDYNLYVLLAPRLGGQGSGNTAWVESRGQQTFLMAQRAGSALALACSSQIVRASAGYEGTSDGWQDLTKHKQMTWQYARAENGNVALTAEINLKQSDDFTLALGFGKDPDEAADNATASLEAGFEKAKEVYIKQWQDWHKLSSVAGDYGDFADQSLAVLRTHQSKNPTGAMIAGLASPWGYARGDDDGAGYHIVWARDMVESAGGLLAGGRHEDIRQIIGYLEGVQSEDGHWPQNMWLNGTPYWNGVQMDETALPILLINLARREDAISDSDVLDFWPMAKKAAGFLVRNGPVTQQDRWEEDPGYTPFTLSAEIAGLLAAGDFAELNQEPAVANYLRQTADNWHDALDRWMYAADTDWAKQFNISGYYERIATVDKSIVARFQNTVNVKNVPPEDAHMRAAHLVSPDALALVRFGLRSADDPRIVNTVRMIDKLLKIDTPYGGTWHRYNDDGYGEHTDGSAFDGTGIGRGWPLLTGERAHYELAAGNIKAAEELMTAMEKFASDSGLLPEQVWDNLPIAEYELQLGRPSGSAMPLAWAHAEYLKLARSLKDGRIFDLPHQTVQRYLVDKVTSPYRAWRFNHKIRTMQAGKILRIETMAQAKVRFSSDNWQTSAEQVAKDTGLGVFVTDLTQTASLPSGAKADFTFYWLDADCWENTNFQVEVE